jgi:hypothetical protein
MTPERLDYFLREEAIVDAHRARISAFEKKLEDETPTAYPMSEFDADIAKERKRLNAELAALGDCPR